MSEKQTYWLLEKDLGGEPSYLLSLKPDNSYAETSDPNEALRWATRTEARLTRDRLLQQYHNFHITEHVFTIHDDQGWVLKRHSYKKENIESNNNTVLVTNESESQLVMKLTYSDNSKEQIKFGLRESIRVTQDEVEGLLYPIIQFYKADSTPIDSNDNQCRPAVRG